MYCKQNSISSFVAHNCILWLMIIQNFGCLSTVPDKPNFDYEVTKNNNFPFIGYHGQPRTKGELNKRSDIDTYNLALADNINSANAIKKIGHEKEIPFYWEIDTDDLEDISNKSKLLAQKKEKPKRITTLTREIELGGTPKQKKNQKSNTDVFSLSSLGKDKVGVNSDNRLKVLSPNNKPKLNENLDIKSVNQKNNKLKTKTVNNIDNNTNNANGSLDNLIKSNVNNERVKVLNNTKKEFDPQTYSRKKSKPSSKNDFDDESTDEPEEKTDYLQNKNLPKKSKKNKEKNSTSYREQFPKSLRDENPTQKADRQFNKKPLSNLEDTSSHESDENPIDLQKSKYDKKKGEKSKSDSLKDEREKDPKSLLDKNRTQKTDRKFTKKPLSILENALGDESDDEPKELQKKKPEKKPEKKKSEKSKSDSLEDESEQDDYSIQNKSRTNNSDRKRNKKSWNNNYMMSTNIINLDNTPVSNESDDYNDDYKTAKSYKSNKNLKNFENKHQKPDNNNYRNFKTEVKKGQKDFVQDPEWYNLSDRKSGRNIHKKWLDDPLDKELDDESDEFSDGLRNKRHKTKREKKVDKQYNNSEEGETKCGLDKKHGKNKCRRQKSDKKFNDTPIKADLNYNDDDIDSDENYDNDKNEDSDEKDDSNNDNNYNNGTTKNDKVDEDLNKKMRLAKNPSKVFNNKTRTDLRSKFGDTEEGDDKENDLSSKDSESEENTDLGERKNNFDPSYKSGNNRKRKYFHTPKKNSYYDQDKIHRSPRALSKKHKRGFLRNKHRDELNDDSDMVSIIKINEYV